jgi:hypothetical protein
VFLNKKLLQLRNHNQISILFVTKIIQEMAGSSRFWAVARRRLVAITDVSGQHIGPIFNVQARKEEPGML